MKYVSNINNLIDNNKLKFLWARFKSFFGYRAMYWTYLMKKIKILHFFAAFFPFLIANNSYFRFYKVKYTCVSALHLIVCLQEVLMNASTYSEQGNYDLHYSVFWIKRMCFANRSVCSIDWKHFERFLAEVLLEEMREKAWVRRVF